MIEKELFIVLVLINKECYTKILIDSDYFLYKIISKRFVKKQGLKYILVFLIIVKRFLEKIKIIIKKVVVIRLDIGNISKKVFFYILEKLEESYNLIFEAL